MCCIFATDYYKFNNYIYNNYNRSNFEGYGKKTIKSFCGR